jgi:hypothetical protein
MPASYQGLYASYSPSPSFTFTGLRIFRYKSRTADHFNESNLFNPSNYTIDAIPAYGNTENPGALAFAVNLKKDALTSELWYYKFYNLANLVYDDTRYTFKKIYGTTPYLGAQALREWGDGSNILAPYTTGPANSLGFGFLTGLTLKQADFSLAYNKIPANQHAFESGSVLSPYTTGYQVDPLYTTSMLTSLVEVSSGQAMKLKASYNTQNKNWLFSVSYAKYFIQPISSNLGEVDLDAGYTFQGRLKGFSIRNVLGTVNGSSITGRVVNDHVMLQYTFSDKP